jgi:hypothetical protein
MPEPSTPPRWFIATFAAAVLLVAGWLVSHLYSTADYPARLAKSVVAGSPQRILAGAIFAMGGDTALGALPAVEWSGSATVHTLDKGVDIVGTWLVAPPDTARVTTWPATEDSSRARTLVVAGHAGWLVRNGKTDPMPPDQLVEEQHQFYLYSLLRLLPLRDTAVTLTSLPADSIGEPGILVHRAGRLDVALYFGADQRVSRMHTRFASLPGSPSDDEEVRLEGTVEIAGVAWFRQMRITRNGKPYFDLVVIDGSRATTSSQLWIPATP